MRLPQINSPFQVSRNLRQKEHYPKDIVTSVILKKPGSRRILPRLAQPKKAHPAKAGAAKYWVYSLANDEAMTARPPKLRTGSGKTPTYPKQHFLSAWRPVIQVFLRLPVSHSRHENFPALRSPRRVNAPLRAPGAGAVRINKRSTDAQKEDTK